MSSEASGPLCPRCRRRIAAWRLSHCIYCGEPIPSELKEAFPAPEALKFVDRPSLPPDAARQLELMKVVPFAKEKAPRSVFALAMVLALPAFGAIFFMLYRMVARYAPSIAILVLVAGAGFLGYLGFTLYKAARR